MSKDLSFFSSYGEEDLQKIMEEIILRKLAYYFYQDRNRGSWSIDQNEKSTHGELGGE